MSADTLADLGLMPLEIERLNSQGVHTPRDLALTFLAPDQHEILAVYLGRTVEAVRAVVEAASGHLIGIETAALLNLADRPRAFGVLPPAGATENSTP